jgi:Domain of unknown function (DUF4333)
VQLSAGLRTRLRDKVAAMPSCRWATAVVFVTTLMVGAACSSTQTVGRDGLEAEVLSLAERQLAGQDPPMSATCPEELEEEVGATSTCTLEFGNGDEIRVLARVAKVGGSTVEIAIKVLRG